MSKALKIGGKKFNGRHTTVIDGAGGLILFLATLKSVDKISPGFIDVRRGGHGGGVLHIKSKSIRAGMELRIRRGNTRQSIYVYTSDPKSMMQSVKERFPKACRDGGVSDDDSL
jgi:hypothetical protein